jgi:hypothetical protein
VLQRTLGPIGRRETQGKAQRASFSAGAIVRTGEQRPSRHPAMQQQRQLALRRNACKARALPDVPVSGNRVVDWGQPTQGSNSIAADLNLRTLGAAELKWGVRGDERVAENCARQSS